jgi:hypothetical protein
MQVWVLCFVVFFAATQFYQWVQDVTLPTPVFIVAGALLAIASNADRYLAVRQPRPITPNSQPEESSVTEPVMPPKLERSPNSPMSLADATPSVEPQLPPFFTRREAPRSTEGERRDDSRAC